MKTYQVTKEHCQNMIKGVCEGCGGELEPLETVDNSGQPTYWVGCKHCESFRSGVDKRYYLIARKLIENNDCIPYHHLDRYEYEKKNMLEYWIENQCAGLSFTIRNIDNLLKELNGG